MTGRDVTIGIVGLGGMGMVHADTFETLGASIVAGADPQESQRKRFAERFGAKTYASHDELLADESVDAVVVTTPNRFHEAVAVGALEADRSVLVEKPLAHTLESARRIVAAESNSAGQCLVGFHNRYAGAMQLFDAQLNRDRFGEIIHVEATYVRRRGIPGSGSWFTDSKLAGGGALLDIGVHALDCALYVLGFPKVTEVTGVTRSTYGNREVANPDGYSRMNTDSTTNYSVDDSASAFIRCAGGKTISLEAAWATNRDPSTTVRVRGTEAGAQFDLGDSSLRILEAGTDGTDHYADIELSSNPSNSGYTEQDRHFLDILTGDREIESKTIEQALVVQRVIDAIYRSSDTGRAQRLSADEPTLSSIAE